MKNITLLLLLSVLINSSLFAQGNPFSQSLPASPDGTIRCYSEEMAFQLYETDSEFRKAVNMDLSQQNQKSVVQNFSDSVIRIPVVVHVIYNNASSNISTSQVESQIRILNEDYRRIPGTNGFGNGVDTKYEFFLARKDPNGLCTDGIVRVSSPLSQHSTSQEVQLKNLSHWDPNRYLNMWVVNNIVGGILGYATFPTSLPGNPSLDGVVMADQFFGDEGTSGSGTYGFGRTTTHEVGHWLGLFHTFQGGCGGNCATSGDLFVTLLQYLLQIFHVKQTHLVVQ